jgi:rhodanese-related sulfurtransferase
MDLPLEVAPAQVKERLDNKEVLRIIDVRTSEEHAIASIPGALLIPMDTVPAALQRLEALTDEGCVIVVCHHGVRSLHVVNWLRGQGIENCQSMSGGIEAWSLDIDRSIPRY